MRLGLFLIVLGALLATAPREPFSEEVRAQTSTARAVVGRGSLDVAADGDNPFTQLHDGRRYAQAAPGAAVWLLPAEALGTLAKLPRARQLLESGAAALAVALTCLLFAAELRRRGARPGTTVAATLALGFATGMCAVGRVPDGEALAALLLYFAFVRARRPGTGAAVQASAALGALVLVEPALALPAAVLVIGAAVLEPSRRTPPALLGLAGPLLVGAALVLVHRAHTGWFPPANGDWLQGLDGLLLSTGKSVFLYSPPLLLLALAAPWWWRTRRGEAALGLAVVIATVCAVAALDRWHGDPAWGPRRLAPILPVCAEPIALWLDAEKRRVWRGFAGALVAIGIGVQLLGVVWSPTSFPRLVTAVRLGSGAQDWFVDPPSELHFIPQFSPITGHRWMLWHAIRRDNLLEGDAPWHLLLPQTPKLGNEWVTIHPDWFVLDAPRALAAGALGLCGLLVSIGVALTVRRVRMLA